MKILVLSILQHLIEMHFPNWYHSTWSDIHVFYQWNSIVWFHPNCRNQSSNYPIIWLASSFKIFLHFISTISSIQLFFGEAKLSSFCPKDFLQTHLSNIATFYIIHNIEFRSFSVLFFEEKSNFEFCWKWVHVIMVSFA